MSSSPSRARILDAALALITQRGGADVTMADIARAARVSRQAVYLHFTDRADLFMALVRFADERRGLPAAVRRIAEAPSGVAAMREAVALQARSNPVIWPVARAFDAVRRGDDAAERSWQDRLRSRLEGARRIVARLAEDGVLRADLEPGVAADLLWTVLSLRTWEDLVIERGWSPGQYERHVMDLLLRSLTRPEGGRSGKRGTQGSATPAAGRAR